MLAPLLAAALAATPVVFGSTTYDAHSTAVTGSTRHVGLAGSTAAFPDGYAAVFLNPAGLSGLDDDGIDFGSDSNNVDNFVVDFNDPKARTLDVPLKYSYAGARFISKTGWGLGFTAQVPFEIDQTFLDGSVTRKKSGKIVAFTDQNRVQIRTAQYTVAAGKAFWDKSLGVGLAVNYNKVDEAYDFSSFNPASAAVHADATKNSFSADFGVLYKPRRWLRLGLVYKMGYQNFFADSLNNGLPVGVNWFRSTKVPDRLTFAAAWLPRRDLRLYAQSTYTRGMEGTSLVGTGLFSGTAGLGVASSQQDAFNGHWGVEFVAFDAPDLTVKLWGGGYLEDTGVAGYTRYHRTAGFQVSPWFIDFGVAVDDAELYNNFSVGLGVDLLGLASRVAKKYGKELPI